MSFLEICKDIFDDINYVENLDKDDIESFVNAIMVFTNAEIDKEGLISLLGKTDIKLVQKIVEYSNNARVFEGSSNNTFGM